MIPRSEFLGFCSIGSMFCPTVQWSIQWSNGWSNRPMVVPKVLVGPMVQCSVWWSNCRSNVPMVGPMVQWSIKWSNGRSDGPMVGPMVQWLVQLSHARSNGPMVGPMVQWLVQWLNWNSWMRLVRFDQVNVRKEKLLFSTHWERSPHCFYRCCRDGCCAGSVQTPQQKTISAWLSCMSGALGGLDDLINIAPPAEWHAPIHSNTPISIYHHSSTVMLFKCMATPSKFEHINLRILVRVREA